MAARKRRAPSPSTLTGLMPVGAKVKVYGVKSATQDGSRFHVEGFGGVWQVWEITAAGGQVVEESRAVFCAADRKALDNWAWQTAMSLRQAL